MVISLAHTSVSSCFWSISGTDLRRIFCPGAACSSGEFDAGAGGAFGGAMALAGEAPFFTAGAMTVASCLIEMITGPFAPCT